MPLLITRDMHQQLADLGYSSEQRKKFTPEKAHEIIDKQYYFKHEQSSQTETKENPLETEWQSLYQMWDWAVDRMFEVSEKMRCDTIMGMTATERAPAPLQSYLDQYHDELLPEEIYFLKVSILIKELAEKIKSRNL